MPSGAVAILVAGIAGQLSACAVGALPLALFPFTALLLLGAAWLAARATESRAVVLRRIGTLGSLAVALAGLPSVASGGADALQLKGSLAQMLLGVHVAQALSWRSTRDLRTGLFCAVGLLLLGASYAPDVLVGLPILLGWVAALVAIGQLKGMAWRQLVLPTAVAVVFGLVAFLLVPVPATAGLRSRLAGRADTGQSTETRTSQGSGAFSSDRLDLSLRGALAQDPVLRVDGASATLWQGAVYDTYTGHAWVRPSSTKLTGDGPTYQVGPSSGTLRTDAVKVVGRSDGIVWAPGRLVSFDAGKVLPLSDGLGDVLALRRDLSKPQDYTVTSEVPVTDPGRLASVTGADNVDPRWRGLPSQLPSRVKTLAGLITEGVRGRAAQAAAIETWLRSNATYRLDSPVPGPDDDAVDRFLFVDKTGFCEQFASAEAVLLRALGVPARLVTGFAYGTPDGDQRVYKVSDLHAWVQLWVPGTGWVTSDPTAGVALASGGAVAGVSLRSRVTKTLAEGLRALASIPGGRPALAALLLLVTAVVGAFVTRRRSKPGRPDVLPVRASGGALAAFLRFDERQGLRRRRPEESLAQLRERSATEVAQALEVVELECYAAVAPDPQRAIEVLDRY